VLAALRTQDWRALYRLSDPVLRPGTEEQFVQQLESDGAIVIRRAVVTGPATYTLGTAPATARVPIEMDATIAGRHRHQAGDLVLTYSSGSWRFSDTTS
jgi:hypothetical protein